jgi:predicted nucleic acid-binding protein
VISNTEGRGGRRTAPYAFTAQGVAMLSTVLGSPPHRIVDDLRRLAVVVSPTDVPRVVPTDPDDDHVIAAAVTGQADLIASGDKRDLLPMGSFQGIPIISSQEAVERLEARSKT